MKVKILLIQPPKAPRTVGGEDVFIFEPLALEYLASGVGQDHDVRILDLRLEKDFDRVLNAFSPDIVGITAYTVHVNVVKALFEQVKGWNPRVLTVVGGHHATVSPKDFLSPDIDVVVLGEGIAAFKEISKRFEKDEPLQGIRGTALVKGNNLLTTLSDAKIDLDAFPFPDRNLTKEYRSEYYSEWMKPLASIRTSKGCPFRCKFCAEWKVAGGNYYRRDPQRVVEELGGIAEQNVFFADDESLVDAERMSKLAKLIKEAGIKKRYFLYGRSDTIVRHRELIETWRSIGLERVFVGLEFFRDEDLAYIRKSSTAKDNAKAVQILQETGIDVYASFIIRPDFMRSDFNAFRNYCRDLNLKFVAIAILTPLPGTDLYEEVKDKLITHNTDYCDFIHTLLPTALPLEDFYAEFRRLYTRAIPLRCQISFLKRYALREIPGVIVKGRRFYNRFKTIPMDYEI